MSGNPTWIWDRWPYPTQESSWCRVGCNAHLVVGGLLATHLPTYLHSSPPPNQVERGFHNWKLNRQLLHSKLGTSPLSSGSVILDLRKSNCDHQECLHSDKKNPSSFGICRSYIGEGLFVNHVESMPNCPSSVDTIWSYALLQHFTERMTCYSNYIIVSMHIKKKHDITFLV